MARTPALAALLLLGAGWETEEGDRFDVLAPTRPVAARCSGWAEDTGARFEALLGEFPGKRAAVVAAPEEGPDAPDAAPWRDGGAAWMFPWTRKVPTLEDFQKFPPGSLTADQVRAMSGEDDFREGLALAALREFVRARARGDARDDSWGTPLPDWFDAAVAAHHGTEAAKLARRKRLAGVLALYPGGSGKGGPAPFPGILTPLRELFAMPRPEKKDLLVLRVLDPAARALVEARLGDLLRGGFPDQCLAVLEYLLERYGPGFVRHLAETLCREGTVKSALPWLAAHRKELPDPGPKFPDDIQELETGWIAWLRARPPGK